jgi:hypothetical protein
MHFVNAGKGLKWHRDTFSFAASRLFTEAWNAGNRRAWSGPEGF